MMTAFLAFSFAFLAGWIGQGWVNARRQRAVSDFQIRAAMAWERNHPFPA